MKSLSFMNKENELEVEEVEDIVETKDDEGNDLTDWKAFALKNQGIAKRFKTKLEKAKELIKTNAEKPKEPEKKEKEGFDYAEKAYLKASGIQTDEYPFVQEVLKSTGKSLDDVLESKYFQNELKERREEADTKKAIPEGTKRSSGAPIDSVDYWLAKGELPPKEQSELRRKVVNAKIKKAQQESKFTPNSIV